MPGKPGWHSIKYLADLTDLENCYCYNTTPYLGKDDLGSWISS